MVTAANVHWEHERWAEAGGTLEAAAELCATRPAWRANVAHALSMQGTAPHGPLPPCDVDPNVVITCLTFSTHHACKSLRLAAATLLREA